MRNDLVNITVVPAEPGYRMIYVDTEKKEHWVGESIIAWRIETRGPIKPPEDFYTWVFPITHDGDPASNNIGYLCPDGRAEIPQEASYEDIRSFKEGYFK